MDCPFCHPERETPRLIWQGNKVYVILSNPRLVPGHTLVIPKTHALKLGSLGREEREELFDVAIRVEERMLRTFALGVDLRQNYRPFMAQSRLKIDHVHLHLVPRTLHDEIFQRSQKFERELFCALPKDEERDFIQMLRM